RRIGTRNSLTKEMSATNLTKEAREFQFAEKGSQTKTKKMKNGKLDGKVAVVTGASKGIGAGIAKQCAAQGAAVVVNYGSSKSGADEVVDEITKGGGKAVAVQGDVAKKMEIERLFAATKKAFGKID